MSAKTWFVPRVGSAVIRLLGLSWRIRIKDARYLEQARQHSANVIYAVWHGRLLPLTYSLRNLSIHVLASEHQDGEMLGQTILRLGFGHVRGSSTRGGARAIREMVGRLDAGFDLGITVDGPRGPAFQVKPGPVEIAKLAGAAIVPLTTSSRRHKVFSSWDGFELPLPFTRVDIRYGEPVVVPGDADESMLEEKRIQLETTLRDITRKNDESFGG